MPRLPCIVGVEERDILPGRHIETRIPSGRCARVRLVPVAHASLTAVEAFDELAGAIGRTVIDDDQVEIAIRLGENAIDRLAKDRPAIEGRDDDADGG